MSSKKNILLFNPSFSASNMYLPYFWASAKTYYEHKGQHVEDYNWPTPLFNFYNDPEEIKTFIRNNPPAVFGVSLYVWNYSLAMEIAQWVKETYPSCIVIGGGPHQYFKHESTWFKDHPYLDASLAGDEYGELTLCDLLDNLDNLNWNNVHAVVYPNKTKKLLLTSTKTANKRDFWWEYSAYASQLSGLTQYAGEIKKYNSNYRVQGLLETTRGCPYGCTFCDWGGGTSTKVLARKLEYVKQDIDCLAQLESEGVYICDANLGILKDRDVAIMQYIADQKKKYTNLFSLYYGGYAKTVEAIPYIKKILKIEAENQLMRSMTYKLSLQTLDKETLNNIDRIDVGFDQYQKLSRDMQSDYGYDAYAEIIAGLPGITPSKFYHEINILSKENIGIAYYDWYLLPETPSYTADYRQKYNVQTVKKQYNNNQSRAAEIVISTYSYSTEEFKEMHTSYAWYRAFWTAGFLSGIIREPLGDFTQKFYNDFFKQQRAGLFLTELAAAIDSMFEQFFINTGAPFPDLVKLITSTIYYHLPKFKKELSTWLKETYPMLSIDDIQKELNCIITVDNIASKQGFLFKQYYFNEVFRDTSIDLVFERYANSAIVVPPIKFLRSTRTIF